MNAEGFLDRATRATPGSVERILYGLAAFDALTEQPVVLVGGAAQVIHTGHDRPTHLDVVGYVGPADEDRLRAAGFDREGRHWVFGSGESAIAVEVPGSELVAEEPVRLVVIGDNTAVRVISATDLMVDRVLQATDGTIVTRDEAEQLAIAAGDSINWYRVEDRAARIARGDPFLAGITSLAAELRAVAELAADGGDGDVDLS